MDVHHVLTELTESDPDRTSACSDPRQHPSAQRAPLNPDLIIVHAVMSGLFFKEKLWCSDWCVSWFGILDNQGTLRETPSSCLSFPVGQCEAGNRWPAGIMSCIMSLRTHMHWLSWLKGEKGWMVPVTTKICHKSRYHDWSRRLSAARNTPNVN